MRNKTCCFTGHREIPAEKFMYIKARLDEEIERLISLGYTDFCVEAEGATDTEIGIA